MGARSSSIYRRINPMVNTRQQMIDIVLPFYYSKVPVTGEDLEITKSTWTKIIDDSSPEFQRRRAESSNEEFPYESSISMFYDTFYNRLFDVHPDCKPLFHGMRTQGKHLVDMISMLVSAAANPVKFTELCVKIAEIHNTVGIKAVEYGLVGEVLFYSLQHCLGPQIWTNSVAKVWAKIFSCILNLVIPLALDFELEHGEDEIHKIRNTHMGNTAAETEDVEIERIEPKSTGCLDYVLRR